MENHHSFKGSLNYPKKWQSYCTQENKPLRKHPEDDAKSPLPLFYSLKYVFIHKYQLDLNHFCGSFLDLPPTTFQIQQH